MVFLPRNIEYGQSIKKQFCIVRSVIYVALTIALPLFSSELSLKDKLFQAANQGQINQITDLLEAGADINCRDSDGKTPLIYASAAGHKEAAQLLIDRKAEINIKDNSKWTALNWAVNHSHAEIVKILIAAGADVNTKSTYDRTPLMQAISSASFEIFQMLLLGGADIHSRETVNQDTVLILASRLGKRKHVEQLLQMLEDVNEEANKDGESALIAALKNKKSSDIEADTRAILYFLLWRGANPNCEDRNGNTALNLACRLGDEKIIGMLLSMGAEVNVANTKGIFPLEYAVEGNCLECVQMLVAKGVVVDAKDKTGATAFLGAVSRGNVPMAQYFLGLGATMDVRNRMGMGPLAIAKARNDTEMVLMLQGENPEAPGHETDVMMIAAHKGDWQKVLAMLDSGVDVNAKGVCGNSILDAALINGHVDLAQQLISRGADINTPFQDGRVPLAVASELHARALMIDLILRGADVNPKMGTAPLIWAILRNDLELVQLLLDRKADISAICIENVGGGNLQAMDCALAWGRNEIFIEFLRRGGKPTAKTLFAAAAKNQEWAIPMLLSRGLDVNVRDGSGRTPLLSAAYGLNMAAMRILLEHGADSNAMDEEGETGLIQVCGGNYADEDIAPAAEMLLRAGADPNLQAENGTTALIVAATGGRTDTLRLLLKVGAIIDIPMRQSGRTPLMLAAGIGHVEAVRLLLQAGADPMLKDQQGKTALNLAEELHHPEIANILRDTSKKSEK